MSVAFLIKVFLLTSAPVFGSFIGLLADRVGTGRSLVVGGSRCDHCGERLEARDLTPILSWLLARGRSRCCGRRLRRSLLAVELAALGIALCAVRAEGVGTAVAASALGWTGLALALLALRPKRQPR